jgi:hypothetical protein
VQGLGSGFLVSSEGYISRTTMLRVMRKKLPLR